MNREQVLLVLVLLLCLFSGYLYFKPEDDKKRRQLQQEIDRLKVKNDSIEEVNFCLELSFDTLETERDSLLSLTEKGDKSIDSLKTALRNANSIHFTDLNHGDAVNILSNIEFETR